MSSAAGPNVVLIASIADSVVQFRGALIAELQHRGAAVAVIAPPCDERTRAGIEKLGVQFVPVPMIRNGISPLADLLMLCRLAAILRRLRPTHVLSYTIKPVVFGSLAARIAGVGSICALMTGLGYAFVATGLKARAVALVARGLLRQSLALCQSVIFQNEDDRQLLQRLRLVHRRSRVTTVNGSGVSLSHYALAPMPAGVSFLMIARFLREKGVLEYLQAAAAVHTRYPAIPIRLLGWGDQGVAGLPQMGVERLARDAGVEVLGRTDDVRPVIRNCAVLVLPSYREGTPRTVLEAMAMGRPVITADVPGCRQTVVVGQTGWLVPARDAAALTGAMLAAIDARERLEAMGLAGRRLAEERFDAVSVAKATVDAMGVGC